MSQINPFAGAIAQTPAAQRQAAAERSAQVKRTNDKSKTSGFAKQNADEFVESADAVSAVGDEDHHPDFRKKKRKPDDEGPEEKPHIDLTA